jgi:hypothetical protein
MLPASASAQDSLYADLEMLDTQITSPDDSSLTIGDPVRFIFQVKNNGPDDYNGIFKAPLGRRVSVTVDIDEPSKPGIPGLQVACQYDTTFDFNAVEIPNGQTVTLPTPWLLFPICDSDSVRVTAIVAVGEGVRDTVSTNDTLVTVNPVTRLRRLINHDIEKWRSVEKTNQAPPDTTWIGDFDFDAGGMCSSEQWLSADYSLPTDWARLFRHVTDNDICTENTTCSWLFSDNLIPTIACDPSRSYGPNQYVLNPLIDNAIISPWVSLTSVPTAAGMVLSYDVFPGNRFTDRRISMNWSIRTRVVAGSDTSVSSWAPQSWHSLGSWNWVTVVDDVSWLVEPGVSDVQVRFRLASWGPAGLGCATLPGTGCGAGPGPYLDRVRVGARILTGPAISEGLDSRSQAQDAFPTEPNPVITPGTGEHFRPTTDRFGTTAFSRAEDLGICGGSTNLIPGDSISVFVQDRRNAGGIMSVDWYGAIASGPHAGKAPPPFTVSSNGFFAVAADSARNASGQVIEGAWFVDLDDGYFRGGDILLYFWAATDASAGFASSPAGLSALPSSVDDAESATGGLHEVSFLPTITWDPAYLARIALDDHGDLDPTPSELANSFQESCVLYVNRVDSRRRNGDANRTAFMYTLDSMGYRGHYDVYDHQGVGNTNNQLGGRATTAQATGYNLIVYDAGNADASGTIMPDGTELDSQKIDQSGWFRSWLALANVAESGFATLWVIGSNFLQEKPADLLYTTDMGTALGSTDQGLNVNPDVEGQTGFTFDQGAGSVFVDFTGDEFSLNGGCPTIRNYDGLSPTGSGVETHAYRDPVTHSTGGGSIVMNSNAANDWNTIAQSHPWSDIVELSGTAPGDPTPQRTLIGAILSAALPLACQEARDPTDADGRPDEIEVPMQTALLQNIPNPFNPMTRIEFDLAQDGRVSLRIYDVAGRLVRILIDAQIPKGRYAGDKAAIWDGLDHAGRRVSSGVYFYRLEAPDFMATRKMVMMK